jgi:hypothetical protein
MRMRECEDTLIMAMFGAHVHVTVEREEYGNAQGRECKRMTRITRIREHENRTIRKLRGRESDEKEDERTRIGGDERTRTLRGNRGRSEKTRGL